MKKSRAKMPKLQVLADLSAVYSKLRRDNTPQPTKEAPVKKERRESPAPDSDDLTGWTPIVFNADSTQEASSFKKLVSKKPMPCHICKSTIEVDANSPQDRELYYRNLSTMSTKICSNCIESLKLAGNHVTGFALLTSVYSKLRRDQSVPSMPLPKNPLRPAPVRAESWSDLPRTRTGSETRPAPRVAASPSRHSGPSRHQALPPVLDEGKVPPSRSPKHDPKRPNTSTRNLVRMNSVGNIPTDSPVPKALPPLPDGVRIRKTLPPEDIAEPEVPPTPRTLPPAPRQKAPPPPPDDTASSRDSITSQQTSPKASVAAPKPSGPEPEASSVKADSPAPKAAALESWTLAEVMAWLEKKSLMELAGKVQQEALDGEALVALIRDETEFKNTFPAVGHRLKFKLLMSETSTPLVPPPPTATLPSL